MNVYNWLPQLRIPYRMPFSHDVISFHLTYKLRWLQDEVKAFKSFSDPAVCNTKGKH